MNLTKLTRGRWESIKGVIFQFCKKQLPTLAKIPLLNLCARIMFKYSIISAKTAKGFYSWSCELNFIKIVTIITLTCFILTGVVGQAVAAVLEQGRDKKKFSAMFDDLLVPHTAGRITDGRYFGTKKVVINIQDLHCHPEVQRNISRIISILDTKYKLKKVYLEGAIGDVDTSWLTSMPETDIRQKVVNSLLEQGKLTGAEYYSVTSQRPDLIQGIEDKALYEANISRLGLMIKSRKDIETNLSGLAAELTRLKGAYYNSKQKNLEKLNYKYQKGEIDSKKYYKLLEKYSKRLDIDIFAYGNIVGYLNLLDQEKELNYKRVAWELQEFVTVLKQKLPYKAYNMLLKQTDNFAKLDELYLYLIKMSGDYNLNLSANFANLDKFFKYVNMSQKINPLDLVVEEKKLLREIIFRSSGNQSEREIAFLVEYYKHFQDYFGNRISGDDYDYFTSNLGQFKILWAKYVQNNRLIFIEPYFNLLDVFYKANIKRNDIFIQNLFTSEIKNLQRFPNGKTYVNEISKILNTLKDVEEIKVVVTGGFHTPGLKQLFEKQKISYLVITPNVTQDTKFSDMVYSKIAKEQSRILSQTVALLNLSQNSPEVQVQEAVSTLVGFHKDGMSWGEIKDNLNKVIVNREKEFGKVKFKITDIVKEGEVWRIDVNQKYTDKDKDKDKENNFAVVIDEDGNAKVIQEGVKEESTGSERNISAKNRLGMALTTGGGSALVGAAVSLAVVGSAAGAFVSVIPILFYMLERSYIKKAASRGTKVAADSDAERMIIGQVAEKTGFPEDEINIDSDMSAPMGLKADGKFYINPGHVYQLINLSPEWFVKVAFNHEKRHQSFANKKPWISRNLGFVEEFLVSLSDISDAIIFRFGGTPKAGRTDLEVPAEESILDEAVPLGEKVVSPAVQSKKEAKKDRKAEEKKEQNDSKKKKQRDAIFERFSAVNENEINNALAGLGMDYSELKEKSEWMIIKRKLEAADQENYANRDYVHYMDKFNLFKYIKQAWSEAKKGDGKGAVERMTLGGLVVFSGGAALHLFNTFFLRYILVPISYRWLGGIKGVFGGKRTSYLSNREAQRIIVDEIVKQQGMSASEVLRSNTVERIKFLGELSLVNGLLRFFKQRAVLYLVSAIVVPAVITLIYTVPVLLLPITILYFGAVLKMAPPKGDGSARRNYYLRMAAIPVIISVVFLTSTLFAVPMLSFNFLDILPSVAASVSQWPLVGSALYNLGSVGALLGTFLTSFVLVSSRKTKSVRNELHDNETFNLPGMERGPDGTKYAGKIGFYLKQDSKDAGVEDSFVSWSWDGSTVITYLQDYVKTAELTPSEKAKIYGIIGSILPVYENGNKKGETSVKRKLTFNNIKLGSEKTWISAKKRKAQLFEKKLLRATGVQEKQIRRLVSSLEPDSKEINEDILTAEKNVVTERIYELNSQVYSNVIASASFWWGVISCWVGMSFVNAEIAAVLGQMTFFDGIISKYSGVEVHAFGQFGQIIEGVHGDQTVEQGGVDIFSHFEPARTFAENYGGMLGVVGNAVDNAQGLANSNSHVAGINGFIAKTLHIVPVVAPVTEEEAPKDVVKEAPPVGVSPDSEGYSEWLDSQRGRVLYLDYDVDDSENDYLKDFANTYSQSLIVIRNVEQGNPVEAKELLDYFEDKYEKTGKIFRSNKEYVENTGETTWLGISAMQYKSANPDLPGHETLLKGIDNYLFDMQSNQGYFYGIPGEKWGATEHQLDILAYLDMRYMDAEDPQYKAKLRSAQIELARYLVLDAYNAEQGFFAKGVNGLNDKGFTTDTASWGVQVLSAIETMDPGLYIMPLGENAKGETVSLSSIDKAELLETAGKKAKIENYEYTKPDGTKVVFDNLYSFGDYHASPPTPEFSAQMALSFKLTGQSDKADAILSEIDETKRFENGAISVPYALHQAPTFRLAEGGWKATTYSSIDSTVHTEWAEEGFNPFLLIGPEGTVVKTIYKQDYAQSTEPAEEIEKDQSKETSVDVEEVAGEAFSNIPGFVPALSITELITAKMKTGVEMDRVGFQGAGTPKYSGYELVDKDSDLWRREVSGKKDAVGDPVYDYVREIDENYYRILLKGSIDTKGKAGFGLVVPDIRYIDDVSFNANYKYFTAESLNYREGVFASQDEEGVMTVEYKGEKYIYNPGDDIKHRTKSLEKSGQAGLVKAFIGGENLKQYEEVGHDVYRFTGINSKGEKSYDFIKKINNDFYRLYVPKTLQEEVADVGMEGFGTVGPDLRNIDPKANYKIYTVDSLRGKEGVSFDQDEEGFTVAKYEGQEYIFNPGAKITDITNKLDVQNSIGLVPAVFGGNDIVKYTEDLGDGILGNNEGDYIRKIGNEYYRLHMGGDANTLAEAARKGWMRGYVDFSLIKDPNIHYSIDEFYPMRDIRAIDTVGNEETPKDVDLVEREFDSVGELVRALEQNDLSGGRDTGGIARIIDVRFGSDEVNAKAVILMGAEKGRVEIYFNRGSYGDNPFKTNQLFSDSFQPGGKVPIIDPAGNAREFKDIDTLVKALKENKLEEGVSSGFKIVKGDNVKLDSLLDVYSIPDEVINSWREGFGEDADKIDALLLGEVELQGMEIITNLGDTSMEYSIEGDPRVLLINKVHHNIANVEWEQDVAGVAKPVKSYVLNRDNLIISESETSQVSNNVEEIFNIKFKSKPGVFSRADTKISDFVPENYFESMGITKFEEIQVIEETPYITNGGKGNTAIKYLLPNDPGARDFLIVDKVGRDTRYTLKIWKEDPEYGIILDESIVFFQDNIQTKKFGGRTSEMNWPSVTYTDSNDPDAMPEGILERKTIEELSEGKFKDVLIVDVENTASQAMLSQEIYLPDGTLIASVYAYPRIKVMNGIMGIATKGEETIFYDLNSAVAKPVAAVLGAAPASNAVPADYTLSKYYYYVKHYAAGKNGEISRTTVKAIESDPLNPEVWNKFSYEYENGAMTKKSAVDIADRYWEIVKAMRFWVAMPFAISALVLFVGNILERFRLKKIRKKLSAKPAALIKDSASKEPPVQDSASKEPPVQDSDSKEPSVQDSGTTIITAKKSSVQKHLVDFGKDAAPVDPLLKGQATEKNKYFHEMSDEERRAVINSYVDNNYGFDKYEINGKESPLLHMESVRNRFANRISDEIRGIAYVEMDKIKKTNDPYPGVEVFNEIILDKVFDQYITHREFEVGDINKVAGYATWLEDVMNEKKDLVGEEKYKNTINHLWINRLMEEGLIDLRNDVQSYKNFLVYKALAMIKDGQGDDIGTHVRKESVKWRKLLVLGQSYFLGIGPTYGPSSNILLREYLFTTHDLDEMFRTKKYIDYYYGSSDFLVDEIDFEKAEKELKNKEGESGKINSLVLEKKAGKKDIASLENVDLLNAFNEVLNMPDLYKLIDSSKVQLDSNIIALLKQIKKQSDSKETPHSDDIRKLNKAILLKIYPHALEKSSNLNREKEMEKEFDLYIYVLNLAVESFVKEIKGAIDLASEGNKVLEGNKEPVKKIVYNLESYRAWKKFADTNFSDLTLLRPLLQQIEFGGKKEIIESNEKTNSKRKKEIEDKIEKYKKIKDTDKDRYTEEDYQEILEELKKFENDMTAEQDNTALHNELEEFVFYVPKKANQEKIDSMKENKFARLSEKLKDKPLIFKTFSEIEGNPFLKGLWGIKGWLAIINNTYWPTVNSMQVSLLAGLAAAFALGMITFVNAGAVFAASVGISFLVKFLLDRFLGGNKNVKSAKQIYGTPVRQDAGYKAGWSMGNLTSYIFWVPIMAAKFGWNYLVYGKLLIATTVLWGISYTTVFGFNAGPVLIAAMWVPFLIFFYLDTFTMMYFGMSISGYIKGKFDGLGTVKSQKNINKINAYFDKGIETGDETSAETGVVEEKTSKLAKSASFLLNLPVGLFSYLKKKISWMFSPIRSFLRYLAGKYTIPESEFNAEILKGRLIDLMDSALEVEEQKKDKERMLALNKPLLVLLGLEFEDGKVEFYKDNKEKRKVLEEKINALKSEDIRKALNDLIEGELTQKFLQSSDLEGLHLERKTSKQLEVLRSGKTEEKPVNLIGSAILKIKSIVKLPLKIKFINNYFKGRESRKLRREVLRAIYPFETGKYSIDDKKGFINIMQKKFIPAELNLNKDQKDLAAAQMINLILEKLEIELRVEEDQKDNFKVKIIGEGKDSKVDQQTFNIFFANIGNIRNEAIRKRMYIWLNQFVMDSPEMPVWERMRGMSILIPFGPGEENLYSWKSLTEPNNTGTSDLAKLKKSYDLEFNNFIVKIKRSGKYHADHIKALEDLDYGKKLELKDLEGRDELINEIRYWASLRGQAFARTMTGVTNYIAVLKFYAKLNHPEWDEDKVQKEVEKKLQVIWAHQSYGDIKFRNNTGKPDKEKSDKAEVEDTEWLCKKLYEIEKFGNIDIVYLLNGGYDKKKLTNKEADLFKKQTWYRARAKYNPETKKIETTNDVLELTEDFAILGYGKPGNLNHAKSIVDREITMALDMNQDIPIEECFSLANTLALYDDPNINLVGFPETIMSYDFGAEGSYAAFADRTFTTLIQRDYAMLGIRYHYGHPDTYRSSVSDKIGGFAVGNYVPEDLTGAQNLAAREVRPAVGFFKHPLKWFKYTFISRTKSRSITFVEYVEILKGREVNWAGMVGLLKKFSAGNFVVTGGRVGYLYFRTKTTSAAQKFSQAFGSSNFYNRKPVIIWGALITYIIFVMVFGISGYAAFNNQFFYALVGAVLFAQAITTTGLFQMILEKPLFKAIKDFLIILPPMAYYFMSQVFTASSGALKGIIGISTYIGTGRGAGLEHTPIKAQIERFGDSHIKIGGKMFAASMIGIWVWMNVTLLFSATFVIMISSALFGPFVFNRGSFPGRGVRIREYMDLFKADFYYVMKHQLGGSAFINMMFLLKNIQNLRKNYFVLSDFKFNSNDDRKNFLKAIDSNAYIKVIVEEYIGNSEHIEQMTWKDFKYELVRVFNKYLIQDEKLFEKLGVKIDSSVAKSKYVKQANRKIISSVIGNIYDELNEKAENDFKKNKGNLWEKLRGASIKKKDKLSWFVNLVTEVLLLITYKPVKWFVNLVNAVLNYAVTASVWVFFIAIYISFWFVYQIHLAGDKSVDTTKNDKDREKQEYEEAKKQKVEKLGTFFIQIREEIIREMQAKGDEAVLQIKFEPSIDKEEDDLEIAFMKYDKGNLVLTLSEEIILYKQFESLNKQILAYIRAEYLIRQEKDGVKSLIEEVEYKNAKKEIKGKVFEIRMLNLYEKISKKSMKDRFVKSELLKNIKFEYVEEIKFGEKEVPGSELIKFVFKKGQLELHVSKKWKDLNARVSSKYINDLIEFEFLKFLNENDEKSILQAEGHNLAVKAADLGVSEKNLEQRKAAMEEKKATSKALGLAWEEDKLELKRQKLDLEYANEVLKKKEAELKVQKMEVTLKKQVLDRQEIELNKVIVKNKINDAYKKFSKTLAKNENIDLKLPGEISFEKGEPSKDKAFNIQGFEFAEFKFEDGKLKVYLSSKLKDLNTILFSEFINDLVEYEVLKYICDKNIGVIKRNQFQKEDDAKKAYDKEIEAIIKRYNDKVKEKFEKAYMEADRGKYEGAVIIWKPEITGPQGSEAEIEKVLVTGEKISNLKLITSVFSVFGLVAIALKLVTDFASGQVTFSGVSTGILTSNFQNLWASLGTMPVISVSVGILSMYLQNLYTFLGMVPAIGILRLTGLGKGKDISDKMTIQKLTSWGDSEKEQLNDILIELEKELAGSRNEIGKVDWSKNQDKVFGKIEEFIEFSNAILELNKQNGISDMNVILVQILKGISMSTAMPQATFVKKGANPSALQEQLQKNITDLWIEVGEMMGNYRLEKINDLMLREIQNLMLKDKKELDLMSGEIKDLDSKEKAEVALLVFQKRMKSAHIIINDKGTAEIEGLPAGEWSEYSSEIWAPYLTRDVLRTLLKSSILDLEKNYKNEVTNVVNYPKIVGKIKMDHIEAEVLLSLLDDKIVDNANNRLKQFVELEKKVRNDPKTAFPLMERFEYAITLEGFGEFMNDFMQAISYLKIKENWNSKSVKTLENNKDLFMNLMKQLGIKQLENNQSVEDQQKEDQSSMSLELFAMRLVALNIPLDFIKNIAKLDSEAKIKENAEYIDIGERLIKNGFVRTMMMAGGAASRWKDSLDTLIKKGFVAISAEAAKLSRALAVQWIPGYTGPDLLFNSEAKTGNGKIAYVLSPYTWVEFMRDAMQNTRSAVKVIPQNSSTGYIPDVQADGTIKINEVSGKVLGHGNVHGWVLGVLYGIKEGTVFDVARSADNPLAQINTKQIREIIGRMSMETLWHVAIGNWRSIGQSGGGAVAVKDVSTIMDTTISKEENSNLFMADRDINVFSTFINVINNAALLYGLSDEIKVTGKDLITWNQVVKISKGDRNELKGLQNRVSSLTPEQEAALVENFISILPSEFVMKQGVILWEQISGMLHGAMVVPIRYRQKKEGIIVHNALNLVYVDVSTSEYVTLTKAAVKNSKNIIDRISLFVEVKSAADLYTVQATVGKLIKALEKIGVFKNILKKKTGKPKAALDEVLPSVIEEETDPGLSAVVTGKISEPVEASVVPEVEETSITGGITERIDESVNPVKIFLNLVGRSINIVSSEFREYLKKEARNLVNKSVVMVSIAPDLEKPDAYDSENLFKMAMLNEAGMKPLWITLTKEPADNDVKIFTDVFYIEGENRVFDVYASRNEFFNDNKEKIGEIGFLKIRDTRDIVVKENDTLVTRKSETFIADDILLGSSALELLKRINQDPVVRKQLREFGIDFVNVDILELGRGGGLANPKMYDDTYINQVFKNSLVINNPGKPQLRLLSSAELAGLNNIAKEYMKFALNDKGELDLNKFLLKTDKSIGGSELKNLYAPLSANVFEVNQGEMSVQKLKEMAKNLYSQGLEDKSTYPGFIGRFLRLTGVVPVSATRGEGRAQDRGIGKWIFLSALLKKLIPAGIYTLELWPSTDPLSGSLLANDPLLTDLYGVLKNMPGINFDESKLLNIAALNDKLIDRNMIAENMFSLVNENYDELSSNSDFRKYVSENGEWLREYAKERVSSTVESWGAGVSAERKKDIYMLLQWLADIQEKSAIKSIHETGKGVAETGVYFTIDVTADNYEQVFNAMKQRFAKGYDGVRINVGEGVLTGKNVRKFLEDLEQVINRQKNPVVLIKFAEGVDKFVLSEAGKTDFIDEVVEVKIPAANMNLIKNSLEAMRTSVVSMFIPAFLGKLDDMDEEIVVNDRKVKRGFVERLPAEGKSVLSGSLAKELSNYIAGLRLNTPESMYAEGNENGSGFTGAEAIGSDAWDKLSDMKSEIKLNYTSGEVKNIEGKGLIPFLKAYDNLLSDNALKNPAKEYSDGNYFFDMAQEIFGKLEFDGAEKQSILEYISELRKDAAGRDAEYRTMVNIMLFGFVRGVLENMLESRYAAKSQALPVKPGDRKNLKSILLSAYELGVTPEDQFEKGKNQDISVVVTLGSDIFVKLLGFLKGDIARIETGLLESAAVAEGKTIVETMIYLKAFEKAKGDDISAEEFSHVVSAEINPVTNGIAKTGILPESLSNKVAVSQSRQWAISEMLKMLQLINEWKYFSILDELKNKTKVLELNAIRSLEGAA